MKSDIGICSTAKGVKQIKGKGKKKGKKPGWSEPILPDREESQLPVKGV
jgi:hypothetical protein